MWRGRDGGKGIERGKGERDDTGGCGGARSRGKGKEEGMWRGRERGKRKSEGEQGEQGKGKREGMGKREEE